MKIEFASAVKFERRGENLLITVWYGEDVRVETHMPLQEFFTYIMELWIEYQKTGKAAEQEL